MQPERTGGKGLFSFAYLKQSQSKKQLKCWISQNETVTGDVENSLKADSYFQRNSAKWGKAIGKRKIPSTVCGKSTVLGILFVSH
ncbi:MAG TPA: hypothetical protein DCM18_06740 [Ruminococcus sp.]|nr:hypothetical protein [Ruminococcus sp.]HCW12325.1 hypothetical protein [Ruminococcus sp.]